MSTAPFLNAPLLSVLHLAIAVLQRRIAEVQRAIADELALRVLMGGERP